MGDLQVPPQEDLLGFIEREEQRLAGREFDVPRENLQEF